MADGESKKYWMYAQVEEDNRDAMMMIAGHEGKHITKVVEMAVEYFIAAWVDDEDNPDDPDVKLRRIAFDTRRRQNRFVMLKQLAYAHNDEQTDDSYEMLEKACDLAGVDVEIVLETINKSAEIAQSKVISMSGSSMQAAEMWLEELLIDTGNMMPVAEIHRLADERGYKWHTVQKAKIRRKIQSLKDGLSLYWIRSPGDLDVFETVNDQVAGDDVF